jgi:hypothetical protein
MASKTLKQERRKAASKGKKRAELYAHSTIGFLF